MTSDPTERPDPEHAALLRQARAQAEASLSAERRARLAERLERSLGGDPPPEPGSPPPAAPAPPPAAAPAAQALAAVAGSKAAVAVVSLLAGVAVGFQARGVYDQTEARHASSGAPSASAAPALAASLSLAPAATSAPPGMPSASAPPPASPAASGAAAASAAAEASAPLSREESLRAERALIDVARTAVGRGQAAAAITALERHAREFPSGRLSEEREGMWIQALVMAGRTGEARARLERFRRFFPRSMMLPGLEAALGEGP